MPTIILKKKETKATVVDTVRNAFITGRVGKVEQINENLTHIRLAEDKDGVTFWYSVYFRNHSYERNGKTVVYPGADYAIAKLTVGDRLSLDKVNVSIMQKHKDEDPYFVVSISRYGFATLTI